MRFTIGSVVALAVSASLGVFGFISPAAAEELPGACTTNASDGGIGDGLWTIDVTAGPCPVSCDASASGAFCGSGTGCTGIEYTVTSNSRKDPDHTIISTTAGTPIVYPDPMSSGQVFEPCVGDSVTNVGEYQCHLQAVRLNSAPDTQMFRLVADGDVPEELTSIVIKSGSKTESCPIKTLGGGDEAPPQDPFVQAVLITETMTFKGCTVNFQFNADTGEVVDFELAEGSAPGCTTRQSTARDVLVSLIDQDVQPVIFGNDAIFTVGDESCAVRIIGGRAYYWCTN